MEHAHGGMQGGVDAATRHRSAVARVPDACRWALCVVLTLSAAAKLLTPHRDEYVVPEPLYYLGAAVELAAVVLLLTKYRAVAIATAIALAVAGITLAIVVPDRPCGCLGSLMPLGGASHVLVSGFVGALACLSLRPRCAPCQAEVLR